MKVKTIIFVFCTLLFGCRKDNALNVTLNGALTGCPANNTCTYIFYNNADFSPGNQPKAGNGRVFGYKSIISNFCGATSGLYFETSLSNNDFDITSDQIVSAQVVAYNIECPCCEYAVLTTKPIGGEIKGKRVNATSWLVNASVILGTSANIPVDTLTVNQYFTLGQLP